jgi:hypothetical protein
MNYSTLYYAPETCFPSFDQYHRRGLRGPAEEISKYLQQLEIATIPVWMPIARFNSCPGRERVEYSYGKDLPTLLHVVSCGAVVHADSNVVPKCHARLRLPRDCAILVCCVLLTPCSTQTKTASSLSRAPLSPDIASNLSRLALSDGASLVSQPFLK